MAPDTQGGDPRVDSIPADLAPQEAVLNAGGADMLGRGLIGVLNAIGALKMGMPPDDQGAAPAPAQGAPQGLARGTSKVQPKAAAKGKGDAGQANALMALLGSMGGAPGGAPSGGALLGSMGGAPGGAPSGGAPMGMAPPQHFACGTSRVTR